MEIMAKSEAETMSDQRYKPDVQNLLKLATTLQQIFTEYSESSEIPSAKIARAFSQLKTLQARHFFPISINQCKNQYEFLKQLTKPINTWIQGDLKTELWTQEPLLMSFEDHDNSQIGLLSSISVDLINHGISLEKGGEQEKITEVREFLENNQIPNAQILYITFRKFLIENATVDRFGNIFRDIMAELHLKLEDYYERVPSSKIYAGKTIFCPICKWPMNLNISDHYWYCPNDWCKEKNALFRFKSNNPLELEIHRQYSIDFIEAQQILQLRQALWRFTLIPGLLELKLAEKVSKLGYNNDLWPELDHKGDLCIKGKKMDVYVDVKCWLSSSLLKIYLLEREKKLLNSKWYKDDFIMYLVIPNSQRTLVTYLQSNLTIYKIFTEDQFVKFLEANL